MRLALLAYALGAATAASATTPLNVDAAAARADIATLVHVHAIWRHGDRSPSILIPSDTHNNISTWRDGLGELTAKGLRQEYRLGQLIRARYDGFLSRQYSPFEIYVRSSDYNRTLASAQANLAGMYPPAKSEMFTPNLNWRPIPVHTKPRNEDKELYTSVLCPNADAEEAIVYDSPAVKRLEAFYRDKLLFLGEVSGWTPRGTPLRLRDAWKLFDPLWSERNHLDKHEMPKWVNESVWASIFELYHLSSGYTYGSPLLRRLRAGPLYSEVLQRMEARAFGRLDARERLYAYSAHDTAVAAILAGFGLTPTIFPEYACAAFVELHNVSGTWRVRLFYKNETDRADVHELRIPHCAPACTLEALRVVTAASIPTNWLEECGVYALHFPHIHACMLSS